MHTFTESFGCAKTAEKTRNVKWGRCPAINGKESRFTVEKSLTAPYKKKRNDITKNCSAYELRCNRINTVPSQISTKLSGMKTWRNRNDAEWFFSCMVYVYAKTCRLFYRKHYETSSCLFKMNQKSIQLLECGEKNLVFSHLIPPKWNAIASN